MAEVDPTLGVDQTESKGRLDDIKYYTSLFLGTVCLICVFGFLFLVPFVLDPAISTLMHDFVESPVHCRVTSYELRYGKSNCSWASCREGCTASIYKCQQIRVVYTPNEAFNEGMNAVQFDGPKWQDLSRIERPKDPDTGATCYDEDCPEYIVEDTPLLINIKGCGYPPEVNCDNYSMTYSDFELSQDTFPCYYSRKNPWIVISEFNKDEEMSNVIFSIVVPNLIFILSLIVLVYWYCPYCQARCRKYEEHTDLGDPEDESEAEDYPNENPRQ